MHALRHPDRRLVIVLLLALSLRALIPAGFMPGGATLVELCTSDGMRSVLVDPVSGERVDDRPHAEDSECPWALVLVSAVLPSSASSALPPVPAGGQAMLADAHYHRNLQPGLPPARAPPFFPSVPMPQA